LQEAKPVLRGLCMNGTLDEADCAMARITYNRAVTAYQALGAAAIIAIDSEGDAQYRQYRGISMELAELLITLNMFLVTNQE
jgi:hypothetical protein